MTPEQFVFWLQGFLEVSGVSEINEQQLRIVRDHLELVLSKRTPAYVQYTQPVPVPTWETVSGPTSVYPRGPKCGTCGVVCSEEGGTCKRCVHSTTTSGPSNRIDPFSTPEPAGLCDGCGKECPHSELNTVISSNLAGVVLCDECRQPKRSHGLNILEAPIVDVPCVLTC